MYSNRAIPHETRIAIISDELPRNFRCPYHAIVINRLDIISSTITVNRGFMGN